MIKRVLIVLVLLAAAVAAGGYYTYTRLELAATTAGSAAELQKFEVPAGSSLRSVLQALQKQHLIRDARLLEWYLRCCQRGTARAGTTIKAGRYRLVPGQPPLEILRQLIEGKVVLEHVTIPEGWTFADMRERLDEEVELKHTLEGRSDAEVMAELGMPDIAAEGRFAPDTYTYAPGVTTDLQVLSMALEAQRRILEEAWEARQPDLPLQSADEALTLASIVEKETGLGSERAKVAGVFVNRLRKHMALQSDPTVIYGIGDRYDGNIRKTDLRTDTPYNTYTRTGLPPTPIALPGRAAITAVMHPEKTNALFFVALGDGSGGHYFSATFAEHNLALHRYLERTRAPPAAPATVAPVAESEPVNPGTDHLP